MRRLTPCLLGSFVFGACILALGRIGAAPALDNPDEGRVLKKPTVTIQHGEEVICAAWSPDGKRIAFAGAEKAIVLSDASNGEEVTRLKGASSTLLAIAFSRDNRIVVASGEDGAIHYWDYAAGKIIFKMVGHTGAVSALALSPDGKCLASGGEDKSICVWDTTTVRQLNATRGSAPVRSLSFSPDGKFLASAVGEDGKAGSVSLLDIGTGKETLTIKDAHRCVAFSPDGARLAAADGSEDSLKAKEKRVKVWDTGGDAKPVLLAAKHPSDVTSVAFSPNGKYVASAGDNKARICDAATGKLVLTLEHGGAITVVAFSADGRRLLTAGKDKTVKIWDFPSEKELAAELTRP